MERVKKGERYWYVVNDCDGVDVEYAYDDYTHTDKALFELGNYFTDRESAEAMAKKLRAVLKGADVIEMPSEKEFYEFAPSTNKLGGFSLENRRQVRGFQDCWDWIKSKIVK